MKPLISKVLTCLPASAAAAVLLVAGCDARKPDSKVPPGPVVLARVGASVITDEDLRQEILRRRHQRQIISDPAGLLREMAEALALETHARSQGLDRDPEIAHEIRNLLIRRLLEREVRPSTQSAEPTAAQIEEEYQRTIGKYTVPAMDRLAILFLEVPKNASEARRMETRQRLESARTRALAESKAPTAAEDGGYWSAQNLGFGSWAAEYSDDQASRYRGGDVGWLESGNVSYRFPQTVLQTGFDLPKGGISDVIESTAGFYLVRKSDSRSAVAKPLAQVESGLRQSLRSEQRKAMDAAYRREVEAKVGMTVDDGALAAFVPPPTGDPVTNLARHAHAAPAAFENLGGPVTPESSGH